MNTRGCRLSVAALALAAIFVPAFAQAGLDEELISAAGRGDVPRLSQLLDQGARVDAKGDGGRTALMAACGNCRVEAVRLLLDRGARIEARDGFGQTALLLAAKFGCLNATTVLLDASPKPADANSSDDRGMTALMLTAAGGYVDEARALLQRGALSDARDIHGQTALMRVASFSRADLARLLLDNPYSKADVNARDADGVTALMTAVQATPQGVEMVKMLLAAGANASLTTKLGDTAYSFAFNGGALEGYEQYYDELLAILRKAMGSSTPSKTASSALSKAALRAATNAAKAAAVRLMAR